MTFRLSASTIKEIRLENKKTWPMDLDVWVDISLRHPLKEWEAPFYLSHIQVKAFKEFMKKHHKIKSERVKE